MAQHAILRFEKHKGHPAGPLEAHHERKKEQYASNPDIDTSRSKYNFHIVEPEGRYYHFIQSRIEQAGCRTRHMGIRPTVRGSVMNPCDHPHGGGEGKSPIGRPSPVTPWGKPAMGYKTRKKNHRTDKQIARRRNGK